MAGDYEKLILFLFSMCFAVIIRTTNARLAVVDAQYWKQREAIAKNFTLNAYHPRPHEVTDHLNLRVSKAVEMHNSSRRVLKAYRGPCVADNPIDACWRCRHKWARHRFRLADCGMGFGRNTKGGKNGLFYVVTDPSDNDMVNPKPGTLRHAVTRDGPLWIIFKYSMIIQLRQELIITSDKTIDGRGANVQIRNGCGFTLQFVHNVIIHNIHFHNIVPGSGGLVRDAENHFGLRTRSDGDCVSIFGSSNIWIDHVSMSSCTDGMIDVIQGSTGVTISNSHFTKHNEVMLFGASDGYSEDAKMQVTVAFNHFGKGLVQRMPRCRWGLVHVVNNDYTHWQMYAIGGSSHPTIISQGNRFVAPPNIFAKEVTKRDYAPDSVWKNWIWRSENDLFLNGAFFVSSGAVGGANPVPWLTRVPPQSGTLVSLLTRQAGTLNCWRNQPC